MKRNWRLWEGNWIFIEEVRWCRIRIKHWSMYIVRVISFLLACFNVNMKKWPMNWNAQLKDWPTNQHKIISKRVNGTVRSKGGCNMSFPINLLHLLAETVQVCWIDVVLINWLLNNSANSLEKMDKTSISYPYLFRSTNLGR